jgi:hypothetical protein
MEGQSTTDLIAEERRNASFNVDEFAELFDVSKAFTQAKVRKQFC